jgi:hypothetical protein
LDGAKGGEWGLGEEKLEKQGAKDLILSPASSVCCACFAYSTQVISVLQLMMLWHLHGQGYEDYGKSPGGYLLV